MFSAYAALLFCAVNSQYAVTNTALLGQHATPQEWSLNGRYLLFIDSQSGESLSRSRDRARTGDQSKSRKAVKRYDAESGLLNVILNLEESAFIGSSSFVGEDGDSLISTYTLPEEARGAAVSQLWFAPRGGLAIRVGDPLVNETPIKVVASKVRSLALVVLPNPGRLEAVAIGADSTRLLTCVNDWQRGSISYPTTKGTFAMAVSRPGPNGETESALLEVDPVTDKAVPLDLQSVRPESLTQTPMLDYDRIPILNFGASPSFRLVAKPKEPGSVSIPVLSGLSGAVVTSPNGLRVAAVTELGLVVRELVKVDQR